MILSSEIHRISATLQRPIVLFLFYYTGSDMLLEDGDIRFQAGQRGYLTSLLTFLLAATCALAELVDDHCERRHVS